MKTLISIFYLISSLFILSSCEKEGYDESDAVGLWQQISVTEDGVEMALTPEQQTCKILIEANGICRYYHQSFKNYNSGNGPTSFGGTWSILDGKWINLTTDKWHFVPSLSTDSNKVVLSYFKDGSGVITGIDTISSVPKQWTFYHLQSRFTILNLSADLMEIRLKTFVGEKKYAQIFAPDPDDFIELTNVQSGKVNYIPKLVTDQNYWTIRKEYQTLKIYVFRFRKEIY